jgi:hypothetical protein
VDDLPDGGEIGALGSGHGDLELMFDFSPEHQVAVVIEAEGVQRGIGEDVIHAWRALDHGGDLPDFEVNVNHEPGPNPFNRLALQS